MLSPDLRSCVRYPYPDVERTRPGEPIGPNTTSMSRVCCPTRPIHLGNLPPPCFFQEQHKTGFEKAIHHSLPPPWPNNQTYVQHTSVRVELTKPQFTISCRLGIGPPLWLLSPPGRVTSQLVSCVLPSHKYKYSTPLVLVSLL